MGAAKAIEVVCNAKILFFCTLGGWFGAAEGLSAAKVPVQQKVRTVLVQLVFESSRYHQARV